MEKQLTPDQIKKRLKELEILKKAEKGKLEMLKKQKELEIKKTLESNPEKKKILLKKIRKIAITLGITAAVAFGLQQIGNIETKDKKDTETEKIDISKENQQEKTVDRNDIQLEKGTETNKKNIEKKAIQKEVITEKQKIVSPIYTQTSTKIITQSQSNIYTDFTQDEVFVLIEKSDPNIDPDRYSNWTALSNEEKTTVKNIYQQVMYCKTEGEIINVINKINNIKITRGLRDILVKKTILLKKKGKKVENLQLIGQINIKRELAIINQNVKNTQNIIVHYSTEPSTFNIAPIYGLENAENLNNTDGTIKVYFMLQNQGNNIGKIGFDTNGKLITQYINYNNTTYHLSQNENNIYVTEGQLTSK